MVANVSPNWVKTADNKLNSESSKSQAIKFAIELIKAVNWKGVIKSPNLLY